MMQSAFLLSACRTPIGRFNGALAHLHATELGAIAVRAAVSRARVDPAAIDEVIMGNVLTAGTGQAPARQAALRAGLPASVAAMTVNKVCGSGLKAVMLAALAVQSGDARLVVAGGMESMSRAPWLLPRGAAPIGDRELIDSLTHDGLTCPFSRLSMGAIAENLAEQANITRAAQDGFALQSHQRAVAAIASGAFAAEIVPVHDQRDPNEIGLGLDEGPRSDTNLQRLGKLAPAFRSDGSVTPGNSSMISDGAAALVVASSSAAQESGQPPLARILATATTGVNPQDLFIAPVAAIRKVVAKSRYSLADIDLFEINEAFAVQMLACMGQLEISPDRVNVSGGAIAIGHPIGASGARVLVTLLHALQRQGGRLGVAALCLGGGNAVAILIERE